MSNNPFHFGQPPSDSELAALYKLQVQDLADFALFLTDPTGRLLSWNRGVEHIFGYAEHEWLGRDCNVIFTPSDRDAGIPEAEKKAAADHGRASNVRWHIRKDGQLIYLNGIMKSHHSEDGTLLGFSKIAMDDTVRKRLEDALTKSNQDLQQFAFMASHDLQEPLRTLSTLYSTFEGKMGQQGAEDEALLRFMSDAVRRMRALVKDLLDYSQIGYVESGSSSVQLDHDLEAAISLLRGSIEQSGAIITHEALPVVELPRTQMLRLFQNLLSNALKFRKPGQRPIIHVTSDQIGEEWVIRITDNGIGFEPSHAESIFSPFRRLHSAQEYPGSGLGLSACKRIVEGYGGRIGVETKPGEGSTFWFTIPLSRITDSAHP